jgi:hypothetical protein
MEDSLAGMATNRANAQVQNQISMAIMKEQMDQQKAEGAALVKMISQTSLDGTGQLVNRAA